MYYNNVGYFIQNSNKNYIIHGFVWNVLVIDLLKGEK